MNGSIPNADSGELETLAFARLRCQSFPDTLQEALVVRQHDHLGAAFAALADFLDGVVFAEGVLAIERIVKDNDAAGFLWVVSELGEKKSKGQRPSFPSAYGVAQPWPL